jgi:two-component system cell cycle sensor histidine kinase/response regulator CckA
VSVGPAKPDTDWSMTALPQEQDLERRVAERTAELTAALRETEARFRALIENSLDVTAILSADSVVSYVSPSVERILGYAPDELIGATSFDFVHPDDAGVLRAVFEQATLDPGAVQPNEFRARHKDGTWRVMEAIGLNLIADPAVHGMVVTARDVTARRAMEERLRQTDRLEAVGELAGGVAHDFNNVLLVIRGYSSVLRSTLEDPQQIADVDEIARAADRAADLTRQLLAFGRRQVLQPRRLSLAEVISGTEPLLRGTIPESIEVRLELDDGVAPVVADPSQMEHVLVNLVVNARDAMSGHGTITVSLGARDLNGAEDGISPPLHAGRYVVLTVSDTGAGIADDVLPHIFEPFFTTKEDGVGRGLGLSTVYGIVAQSGGGVEVRSDAGGVAFTAYLPEATGSTEDERRHDAASASLARGSERVLLVEDEDPVRELVLRVLESAGYEVLAARLPSEAERLLEEAGHLDLLLTDVVMPEMSGYELVGRVRERRPEMRALFMSGYAHRVSGEAIAEGKLLKKPFSPEQLARAVRTALDDPKVEIA